MDVERYRAKLLKELAELNTELELRRRSRESESREKEMVDVARTSYQQELADAFVLAKENKRERIYLALGRIESGTFGVCRSCKGVISDRRLDFDPTFQTCIKCEEKKAPEARRRIRGSGIYTPTPIQITL